MAPLPRRGYAAHMSGCDYLIAVVDDEELVRRALTRLLRSAGLAVRPFASGREFLARRRDEPLDCLVLDLNMPGLNGLEVQRRLRRLGDTLPVVFITAQDDPAIRGLCLEAGASACLCKPLDRQTLLEAIGRARRR